MGGVFGFEDGGLACVDSGAMEGDSVGVCMVFESSLVRYILLVSGV